MTDDERVHAKRCWCGWSTLRRTRELAEADYDAHAMGHVAPRRPDRPRPTAAYRGHRRGPS